MARRHVIVGMGPVGVAAAEAIRIADPAAQISVIGSDDHGYYSHPGLAYLLTREMPQRRLAPFAGQDLERLGFRCIRGRVTALDLAARRVALADGTTLPYDRLLVATGSRATPPGVPGAELDGVVKLDCMDDALDIIRRCRRAKDTVVVGGRITALEIVEGLRARGLHVHYFMRRDRYWANVLSETESRFVTDGLARQGVTGASAHGSGAHRRQGRPRDRRGDRRRPADPLPDGGGRDRHAAAHRAGV